MATLMMVAGIDPRTWGATNVPTFRYCDSKPVRTNHGALPALPIHTLIQSSI